MTPAVKSTEYLVDAPRSSGVIFVAGATGFVGREVVATFAQRNQAVVAHVRPDSAQLDQWRARFAAMGGAVTVDTTSWDASALTQTLAHLRPAAVYCLIGTTRKHARRAGIAGDIYQAVDVALCRMLADAAAAAMQQASFRARFILLSSVGAGPSRSAYLQARADMEADVRRAGLTATVFRPSVITGARDEARAAEGLAAVMGDAMLAGVGLVAPRLRARYRSIKPDVLARQLADAACDAQPWRVVEAEAIERS